VLRHVGYIVGDPGAEDGGSPEDPEPNEGGGSSSVSNLLTGPYSAWGLGRQIGNYLGGASSSPISEITEDVNSGAASATLGKLEGVLVAGAVLVALVVFAPELGAAARALAR
jgi:hypothetical protein